MILIANIRAPIVIMKYWKLFEIGLTCARKITYPATKYLKKATCDGV